MVLNYYLVKVLNLYLAERILMSLSRRICSQVQPCICAYKMSPDKSNSIEAQVECFSDLIENS